jgi:hypothetical protein
MAEDIVLPQPICGDVNESLTVTSGDALLVLRSAVGQPVALQCGDCPAVAAYGITTELPSSSQHTAHYLLGSVLNISVPATVTHLSLIAKTGGPQVKMALYTDSGGVPDELVVGTTAHTLVAGVQDFPVPATPVAAGDYWIMAVYDTDASIAYDFEDGNPSYAFRLHTFSDPLPAEFGPAVVAGSQSFSYYLRVIQ